MDLHALRTSYDTVADEYVARFYSELAQKPLERHLLNRFAGEVRGRGIVADVGSFLDDAGFVVTESVEREPHEAIEYPSRRCYLFARVRA